MSEEAKSLPETKELTADDLEQVAGGCNGTHIPKILTSTSNIAPKIIANSEVKL